MKKYLIVIDVQRDFVDGALGTAEAQAIIPYVKEKIDACRAEGGSVIFTRDTHAKDYLQTNEGRHLPVEHCIEGSDGWQLYDGIECEGALIIDKPTFGFTDWKSYIEETDGMTVELLGLCTDICVVSNALIIKALYPEARVAVDSKACAGVTPETHGAALTTMKMCQIEIL